MSLEEIRQARLKKIDKINESFGKTFPIEAKRDFSVAEAVESFSKLSRRRKPMNLVGRVFGVRGHGGIIFCDFKDGSLGKEGKIASIQAYVKKDNLEDEKFSLFEEAVDVGDFVEFTGSLFKTQKSHSF